MNLKQKDGATPLMIGKRNFYIEMKINYFFFLNLACKNGHKDVVEILLKNKANPNLKENFGSTALHICKLIILAICLNVTFNINSFTGRLCGHC